MAERPTGRFQTARAAIVSIEVDGEKVRCHVGETVATAMHAAGRVAIRQSARRSDPRGIFCNMGICYECLVYVEGRAVRSCMTPVVDGMRVSTWGPKEPDPS